jgi:hypothetical protein
MATHIKEILGSFFKNSQDLVEKRRRFDMMVDPYLQGCLKGKVVFSGVEKNTMFFEAAASSFSYEFNLRKDKMLKDIQQVFPYIEEIKVKVK